MKEHEIRTLLDLHDEVIDQEDGYWVKLEAWEVMPNQHIPHGVRYSLTLHDQLAHEFWVMTMRML